MMTIYWQEVWKWCLRMQPQIRASGVLCVCVCVCVCMCVCMCVCDVCVEILEIYSMWYSLYCVLAVLQMNH